MVQKGLLSATLQIKKYPNEKARHLSGFLQNSLTEKKSIERKHLAVPAYRIEQVYQYDLQQ